MTASYLLINISRLDRDGSILGSLSLIVQPIVVMPGIFGATGYRCPEWIGSLPIPGQRPGPGGGPVIYGPESAVLEPALQAEMKQPSLIIAFLEEG